MTVKKKNVKDGGEAEKVSIVLTQKLTMQRVLQKQNVEVGTKKCNFPVGLWPLSVAAAQQWEMWRSDCASGSAASKQDKLYRSSPFNRVMLLISTFVPGFATR